MNTETFLNILVNYNQKIFPLQIIVYLFAAISLFFILIKKAKIGNYIIKIYLGLLWIFNGGIFFYLFANEEGVFSYIVGTLFIIQGIIFIIDIFINNLDFSKKDISWQRYIAYFFIFYVLIVYPVIGILFGRIYPKSPLFGVVPCPLVIFTLSIMLLKIEKAKAWFYIIPILWSIITTGAVKNWNIWEDIGLILLGAWTLCFIIYYKLIRNRLVTKTVNK